ncbi:hypothetical protein Syun_009476 [Stephania yunnanensis]|uniref:Uncharacterized protein n=1 Tax=Stephania yunnanensis TaxID=152371 RepID=A0AAP0KEQ4_9MAGN
MDAGRYMLETGSGEPIQNRRVVLYYIPNYKYTTLSIHHTIIKLHVNHISLVGIAVDWDCITVTPSRDTAKTIARVFGLFDAWFSRPNHLQALFDEITFSELHLEVSILEVVYIEPQAHKNWEWISRMVSMDALSSCFTPNLNQTRSVSNLSISMCKKCIVSINKVSENELCEEIEEKRNKVKPSIKWRKEIANQERIKE